MIYVYRVTATMKPAGGAKSKVEPEEGKRLPGVREGSNVLCKERGAMYTAKQGGGATFSKEAHDIWLIHELVQNCLEAAELPLVLPDLLTLGPYVCT